MLDTPDTYVDAGNIHVRDVNREFSQAVVQVICNVDIREHRTSPPPPLSLSEVYTHSLLNI